MRHDILDAYKMDRKSLSNTATLDDCTKSISNLTQCHLYQLLSVYPRDIPIAHRVFCHENVISTLRSLPSRSRDTHMRLESVNVESIKGKSTSACPTHHVPNKENLLASKLL